MSDSRCYRDRRALGNFNARVKNICLEHLSDGKNTYKALRWNHRNGMNGKMSGEEKDPKKRCYV